MENVVDAESRELLDHRVSQELEVLKAPGTRGPKGDSGDASAFVSGVSGSNCSCESVSDLWLLYICCRIHNVPYLWVHD